MALDVNLENVTTFDTEGRAEVYSLLQVARVHEGYRRLTSRFKRRDLRVRRRLFTYRKGKYGALEHDRITSELHNVSLSSVIAHRATALRQALVMEDLGGMHSTFSRKSASSATYLSRMSSWPL